MTGITTKRWLMLTGLLVLLIILAGCGRKAPPQYQSYLAAPPQQFPGFLPDHTVN